MTFNDNLTIKNRIELLERSILVNSYAYYELNTNILSDYQYDQNTQLLAEFKQNYPKEFEKSRYYKYFKNFESGTGTGYYLISMLDSNRTLREKIKRDAYVASKLKGE